MRRNRQERALIALIEQPTVAKAAEISGISQASFFRYLQDKEFRQQYHEAKKARLDAALADLQKATGRAVAVLTEVMEDKAVTPGARVQAARAILGLAVQTGEYDEIVRRLAIVEDRLGGRRVNE